MPSNGPVVDVVWDPAAATTLFPPIHEGRYEVDPWSTGMRVPVVPGTRDAARRAGVRLLRLGLGIWLPSQDPDPDTYPEREWFRGTTLEDTADDALYTWTHLDRNLEICRDLDVELLLSIDYMPASLARPGKKKRMPDHLGDAGPSDYQFPDGVRDAPPRDPEVFAAACLRVLDHVKQSGVPIRYVELWNEPDLPFFYSGSYEEFFPTYRAFATAVSGAGYRVGGPSWAGVLEPELWLHAFVKDCAEQAVPLDFYSFHRYDDQVDKVVQRCRDVRRVLDEAGLTATEAVIDEWGYDLRQADYFGTVGNAAFTSSCLMQMPDAGIAAQTHILLVDPVADPALGRFHGLTRRDGERNPIALAMEAFEQLQQTPHRLPTEHDDLVLVGTDEDRSRLMAILTNPDTEESRTFRLLLPQGAAGELRHLTQEAFEDTGCWLSCPLPANGEVTLGPESLAVVVADLGGRVDPR